MATYHTKLKKFLTGGYFEFFLPIFSYIIQCLFLYYPMPWWNTWCTSLCLFSVVSLGSNTSFHIVQWLKVLTLDVDSLRYLPSSSTYRFVTLGKLPNFPIIQFRHLYNRDNNRTYITGSSCVLNELIHAKHLEQCLSHSKCTANVSPEDTDDAR